MKPEEEKNNEYTQDYVKTLTEFIAISFTLINQTKLWHIQTRNYAAHKAFNKLYNDVEDLSDVFIESFIGTYCCRPITPVLDNLVDFATNQECSEIYKEWIIKLECIREEIEGNHLKNILDEIVAIIRKTLYLLTLN